MLGGGPSVAGVVEGVLVGGGAVEFGAEVEVGVLGGGPTVIEVVLDDEVVGPPNTRGFVGGALLGPATKNIGSTSNGMVTAPEDVTVPIAAG